MGPGMFDSMINGIVALILGAFVVGVGVAFATLWLAHHLILHAGWAK